jgi:tetratricopeptide (TPR) repeat protein
MIRNALDAFSPGAFVAAPLAAETEGAHRWVVYREPWARKVATEFGLAQGYSAVVAGSLSTVEGSRELQVQIEILDCADSRLIASGGGTGSLLDVIKITLGLLGELVALQPDEAVALFRPGTQMPSAYESYAEGLDVLLTLRSQGMELKDPSVAMDPFESALVSDSTFEAAVTAGLSTALQCLESNRIETESTLRVLEGWRHCRPADRRIPAVMVELLIGGGHFEEALRLLCETNEADPDRDLIRRTADLLVEMGRFPEALPLYQKAEEMRHDPMMLERISTLAQMEGQFDLALWAVRKLTNEIDDRPSLWCRLAWLGDKVEPGEEVWSIFRQAFSLDTPPDVEDLLKLNAVLVRRDAEERFVEYLRHWMPPADFSLPARVLLGRALRLCGAHVAAKLCLESIDKSRLDCEFQSVLDREQSALASR